ncbi:XPG-like endonuclease [Lycorma delicatula]|uniref:XPG-like endonuclease n=1 Tax=Lycorma delicatula TaxID=130591 RepID=UPI003F518733
MGVKDLWTVLSPISEKKSLWELQNKTIAIDLSAWICDSQHVGDSSQRNMYLRNLFFRTSFLLLLGVKPIFVLEGTAPELKHATIIARRQARTGKDVPMSGSRSNLKNLQKLCKKLLKTMGVPCVQGSGEAEAFCAWLNEVGVVDAVITQDSDCFLYGGLIVYRNFTMSPTYTCELYDISVIEKKLKLGRNKLLALSLLCGCDYDKGVNGVGKESAVTFLSALDDDEVLDRLKSWRDNPFYDAMGRKKNSDLTPEQKLELSIRKKALQIPGFPSEDIIDEYLSKKPVESIPMIGWSQPNLPGFLEIVDRQLGWEEEYAIEKFLPLVTRWHLLHPNKLSVVKCEMIVKKRIARGINSYECKWSAADLMLDKTDTLLTTVEPQDLVTEIYKNLVEEFIASKKKKTKNGAKKKTSFKNQQDKENIVEDVKSLLHNLSFKQNKIKQPNKKRKNRSVKGLETIDKYFKSKKTSSHLQWNCNLPVTHSTPNIKKKNSNADVSFHFNFDEKYSPSPLRCKNKRSSISKLIDKNTSDSIDITSRWSLSEFLPSPLKTVNHELKSTKSCSHRNIFSKKFDTSMSASFLNISNDMSNDMNMSDIINSFVNNDNNANPAVDFLLKSENYLQLSK